MRLPVKHAEYKKSFCATKFSLKTQFLRALQFFCLCVFVNKRTAEHFIKSVPSAVVLHEKECPIESEYIDYNRKRIEIFGTLIVDLSFFDSR